MKTKTTKNYITFTYFLKNNSILDFQVNIYIFSKLAIRSAEHIIEDILKGKCDLYDSEALQELLKMSPEPEEVRVIHVQYIEILHSCRSPFIS